MQGRTNEGTEEKDTGFPLKTCGNDRRGQSGNDRGVKAGMTEGVKAGMTEGERGIDGSGALASLALEGGNDKGDQRGDTIPPAVIPDVVNRESTGFSPWGTHK